MFTKVFWEMIRNISIHNAITNQSGYNQVLMATSIKDLTGADVGYLASTQTNSSISYGSYSGKGPAIQNANFCILKDLTALVGSGTTTPAYDDYKLGTDKTSSFTSVSTSTNIVVNAQGKVELTVVWTGTNSTSTAITISEVGLKKTLYRSYTASGTLEHVSSMECLIAHDLLDSPITVPAGAGVTVTIKLELS